METATVPSTTTTTWLAKEIPLSTTSCMCSLNQRAFFRLRLCWSVQGVRNQFFVALRVEVVE